MVIAANKVLRWVQPAPTITTGDALVVVTGVPTVRVAGFATAAVVLGTGFPVKVVTAADAPVAVYGDVFQHPLVDAAAEVVFDNEGLVEDNLGVTAAIALADITATCLSDTQVDAPAVFVVFATVDSAPVLSADAEIGFADYGQGSIPLFPFTLPVLFTDNPYGYQTGDAVLAFTSDGGVDAVAGFADATVSVETPAVAQQWGGVPIFPFRFPAVFADEPANIQRAIALLELVANGEPVVAVDAPADAVVESSGVVANPAVFPWLLPVVLSNYAAEAVAVLEFASDNDTQVDTDGWAAVDVYTPFDVSEG